MRIKKLQLLILGAMMPMAMWATPVVVITTADGNTVEVPVESRPKVLVDNGSLMVQQADGSELSFLLSECPKFRFGEQSLANELKGQNPEIRCVNRVIILNGFEANSLVTVFSVAGNLVAQGQTDSYGSLSLDLNGKDTGIYVVKTPIVTTKLIIR